MKAAFYEQFGGVKNIKIGDIEPPEVGEGEVLVHVRAAGVNPVDAGVTNGHLKGRVPHQFPIIPGWDFAGTVEERGFSSRRFDVGDDVYGYARRPVVQWGTFAEYLVIPESYLSKKPANISFPKAGAIPLVGLTAYQALFDKGDLQKNQTVLILGASGGVGSFGIQLAKTRGANVIGVASEKNHGYMRKLGADQTVDYQDEDVGEAVLDLQPEGVDLIFDCTSGDTLQQSLSSLKEDGKLVSILNNGENLDPDINFQYHFVEPNAKELDHLRELVEDDQLGVHISDTFDLDETAKALEQIQKLHTTGKIVITV